MSDTINDLVKYYEEGKDILQALYFYHMNNPYSHNKEQIKNIRKSIKEWENDFKKYFVEPLDIFCFNHPPINLLYKWKGNNSSEVELMKYKLTVVECKIKGN